jgi:hypothetical protein
MQKHFIYCARALIIYMQCFTQMRLAMSIQFNDSAQPLMPEAMRSELLRDVGFVS